jgi:hypothetical protein
MTPLGRRGPRQPDYPRQAFASPIATFPVRQKSLAVTLPCKRKQRSMWETSTQHSAICSLPSPLSSLPSASSECGLDSSDLHVDLWTLRSRDSGLGTRKSLGDLNLSVSLRGIGCASLLLGWSWSWPCPPISSRDLTGLLHSKPEKASRPLPLLCCVSYLHPHCRMHGALRYHSLSWRSCTRNALV